jgi:DNA polymerase-4
MRRIAHVDMDAFFAAVEEQRHLELRGHPLVVGGHGNPNERGIVSAASYAARQFGIHSAMPLRTAYQHCQHAAFLPVDYESYAAISHR